ncbi:MAG: hypothetical protein JO348_01725 [Alphaproteobacteria bacterium]|nr:hypothetical protein [Alphaproteobacteria bacterium]MBV9540689.1 hypothetical protein [Alphaproteobacteria bacterium]
MRIRQTLVLLVAAISFGGCANITDRMITYVGGPERGFMVPAFLSDEGNVSPEPAVLASAQAPQFCVARRYQPGTDAYLRCVFSVQQNLRQAALVTRARPASLMTPVH